jgi:hypothetical protein
MQDFGYGIIDIHTINKIVLTKYFSRLSPLTMNRLLSCHLLAARLPMYERVCFGNNGVKFLDFD